MLQRVETLTPAIMNYLLDMSNNMLLWLRKMKAKLSVTDDVRTRKKALKRLKQAEVFLNFVHNRLQSKFFQFDISGNNAKGSVKRTLK